MKVLIFLIVIGLVVYALVWNMKKTQAKADLARREAINRRKEKDQEALKPDEVMIWPVIVSSTKGEQEESSDPEEPSMTEIEYEPPERMTS